jgi:uncharacterized OB-fold protein
MELPRFHRLRGAYYRLEGSMCRGCGARRFPARRICPDCRSADQATHRFSGRGVVWAVTRLQQAPRGHASLAPYSVGMVRLEEGPMVTAQLVEVGRGELKPGTVVEMVTRKVRDAQEHGLIVYGYKFRPAAPPAGSRPEAADEEHSGDAR